MPSKVKPSKKESSTSDVSYTKKFTETKKKVEKAAPVKGVTVSKGNASAKPYEKKFIPADGKRTAAVIVDGKGNTVKKATSRVGQKTANERLYREFKRDSTNTMNSRNANANFRNISVGAKKNLTAKDKDTLSSLGKIKKK
jgi:hypothetical protein